MCAVIVSGALNIVLRERVASAVLIRTAMATRGRGMDKMDS